MAKKNKYKVDKVTREVVKEVGKEVIQEPIKEEAKQEMAISKPNFETMDSALAYELVKKGFKIKEVRGANGIRLVKLYVFHDSEKTIRGL